MSKFFEIKNCPLCGKILYIYYDGKSQGYYCNTYIARPYTLSWTMGSILARIQKSEGNKIQEPHYSVMRFTNDKFVQSTIIPPYWLINEADSGKSKIYKFPPIGLFELIMEIPVIVPSDYSIEHLIKKIKTLIIFS